MTAAMQITLQNCTECKIGERPVRVLWHPIVVPGYAVEAA